MGDRHICRSRALSPVVDQSRTRAQIVRAIGATRCERYVWPGPLGDLWQHTPLQGSLCDMRAARTHVFAVLVVLVSGGVAGCSGSDKHASTPTAVASEASIVHPKTPAACDVFTAAAVGGALHAPVKSAALGPPWSCSYATTSPPMMSVTGSLQEGATTALAHVLSDQIAHGAVAVGGIGEGAVWGGGHLIARSGRWLLTMDARRGLNQPDEAAAIAITRAGVARLPD
jgi:hypothetical protein